jgi:hypothetical protein
MLANAGQVTLPPRLQLRATDVGIFCGCVALKTVVFPEATTDIPDDMFVDCVALAALPSLDSLVRIGKSAGNPHHTRSYCLPVSALSSHTAGRTRHRPA